MIPGPDNAPKWRGKTADKDEASQAGVFRVGGQREGLEQVDPEELARARGSVTDENLDQGEDTIVLLSSYIPELSNYNPASGVLQFSDGSTLEMNMPGFPNCSISKIHENDRNVELKVSYGENYHLRLSHNKAKADFKSGTNGHIDIMMKIGATEKKLADDEGQNFSMKPETPDAFAGRLSRARFQRKQGYSLRTAIEVFKLRAKEYFMNELPTEEHPTVPFLMESK